MKKPSRRRYWLIQGHDSLEKIFEMKVGIGQLTYDQISRMLQALTAKAGLTFDEIVGAYATRRTKIANDLLKVSRDFQTLTCGTNPWFTATIVDEKGKPVPKPHWMKHMKL